MFEKFIKLIKGRHFYLGVVVFLIVTAIIVRLFSLQIVNGKVLDYYATRGYYSVREIEAPRGNIYDRNGRLIAYNRTGYNVRMVASSDIKKDSERYEMYKKLFEIFDKNGDKLDNIFTRYITPEINFGVLIGDDSDEEKSEIRKNWLDKFINSWRKLDVEKSMLDKLNTARDIFDYLRKDVFKIDEEYSEETAYNIMVIEYNILFNAGTLTYTVPVTLITDVSLETMMEIETRHLEFSGVYTEEVYFRQYNDARSVAHLLGYVRAMSEDDWDSIYKKIKIDENGEIYEDSDDKDGNNNRVYSKVDIIGKEGIEKSAERTLKGIKGSKTIYIDKNGREMGEIYKKDAVAGSDIYLTVDLDLQKCALESLISNVEKVKSEADNDRNFGDCVGGAVVVMDMKTGELLASVSYPDYDPNIFLAPASDKLAQEAISALYTDTDKQSASLNRATLGLYAPGSVFKPVVAITALQENKINMSKTYYCDQTGESCGLGIRCLGHHGNISLKDAMVKSCNIYYYLAGVEAGIDLIDKYAEKFGLGLKTGLEIPEYAGARSNEETMKLREVDLTHRWVRTDTAQTSIGQLYSQFTPVQLARYTAAIGSKGTLFDTHLIKRTVSPGGKITESPVKSSKIEGISDNTFNLVKDSMVGVIEDQSSSIHRYFEKFNFPIAAKTGTPETGEEKFGRSSNAVFICYAPADDPQIAISVVLERGARGGNAAPIAADVLAGYFGVDETEVSLYPTDSTNVKIIP